MRPPGHVRTARMLGHGHRRRQAPAAAAVLSGTISYPHLQAITGTLADLTDHPSLPLDAQTQAVELLVDLAGQVDPAGLRAAARHLRYVLDPDRGKADHDRQTQARRASLAPLLDGTWRLEMLTTAEGGALLTQLLAATGAPTSSDDTRTPTQRRHDALIDALQAAAQSDQLPVANGLSPHILITAPPNTFLPDRGSPARNEPLPDQWRPARFADGTPIPGPLFDQLSCNPTLTRIIQDPAGPVLDVGRAHRFFTPAQRTALWARDRGCRFPGCTAPWTHAHHITPWQQGGPTNLHQRTPPLRPPPPRRPRRPLDHHHRPRRSQQHHHLHPPPTTHRPPQPHPPTRPTHHRVTAADRVNVRVRGTTEPFRNDTYGMTITAAPKSTSVRRGGAFGVPLIAAGIGCLVLLGLSDARGPRSFPPDDSLYSVQNWLQAVAIVAAGLLIAVPKVSKSAKAAAGGVALVSAGMLLGTALWAMKHWASYRGTDGLSYQRTNDMEQLTVFIAAASLVAVAIALWWLAASKS